MATDCYWTLDGDYSYGKDGDVRDTSFDELRADFQEIRCRQQSGQGDWAMHPDYGAGIGELVGHINNRVTAEDGRTRIVGSLTRDAYIPQNAVRVRYVPITKDEIAYFTDVTVAMPVGETRMLKTQLLFDTTEGKVQVLR